MRKNMKVKGLTLVLTASILASLLAGCGMKDESAVEAPAADYEYVEETTEECYEAGMEPSSRSCHGYYRCEMPEEVSEKDDYINDYDKELSSEEDNYRNDYNEEYSSEEERHEEDDTIRRERVHPIFRTQQIQ